MLTAITGLPGSGKSLFAVCRLLEGVASNRPLYANIRGLLLPHEDISDWRTPGSQGQEYADLSRFEAVEDRAVIVIDEAHEYFGAGMGKQMTTAMRSWFAKHRHKGLDIYLLYQDPAQITNQMKVLISDHYHIIRLSGFLGKWFKGSRITFYKGGIEQVKIWRKVVRDNKEAYKAYKTDEIGGAAENAGGGGAFAFLKPMLALICSGVALLFLFSRLLGGGFADVPPGGDEGAAGDATPVLPARAYVPANAVPAGDAPRWSVVKVCDDLTGDCDKYVWERMPSSSRPVVE